MHPGDYRWSSYAANATGQSDTLVQSHPLYQSLGETVAQRRCAYAELFRGHLEAGELHAVREALNQELVLGREDFKDKIETMINRQTRPRLPGRPRVEEPGATWHAV